MFYVYEWFIEETGEIIYVGKGCKNRYKTINKNKLFRELHKRFNCKSRIVQYYEIEKEAFEAEEKRIRELKEIGQAVCNIYEYGAGGVNAIWTDDKRKEWSENNPMKTPEQRNRMSENNPMKNPEIAARTNLHKRKSVIINGVTYEGVVIASKLTGHTSSSIIKWCNRGYDENGNPCRYANEPQKEYEFVARNPGGSKKVWVDDKLFPSRKKAAEYLGIWPDTVGRYIKRNKTYQGHVMRYDNQQPSHANTDKSSVEGSETNG